MLQYIPIQWWVLWWSELGPGLMLFTAISQLQGPSSAREPFNPHRLTSPEETRGHWVMFRKIIRETFSGDCEASKDIFKDIYRCSLVSCQAAGINSHSRLILRSIIQGADVRNWSGGDPVLTSAVLEHCCLLRREEKHTLYFTGTISSRWADLNGDLMGMLKASMQTHRGRPFKDGAWGVTVLTGDNSWGASVYFCSPFILVSQKEVSSLRGAWELARDRERVRGQSLVYISVWKYTPDESTQTESVTEPYSMVTQRSCPLCYFRNLGHLTTWGGWYEAKIGALWVFFYPEYI